MPASPTFPSGKWRKRKREPHVPRKPKFDDEDDDDEDDEEEPDYAPDDDDDPQHQSGLPHPSHDPTSAAAEALSDGGLRISDFPVAVQRTVNRHHSSVLAIAALEAATERGDAGSPGNPISLENVSYGQLQALSAVPPDSPALAIGDQDAASASYVFTPPQIMEGRGVVKRFGNNRVHVLPMHADWFSPFTVHRLERQVVPHFFSGKSPENTPEKYMECRNRIVGRYMENPEKRLSLFDCKGILLGIEMDDLTRIFRFLDHWGIINYCAAAAPNRETWSFGSYLREDFNGEVQVPSAALKTIESLIQFDRPKCTLKAADVYPSMQLQRGEDISDLDWRIRERLSKQYCNYCSQPVPVLYYQSQKEVDIVLCSNCFHDGRFVVGHSSIDFMKMDSSTDYGDVDGDSWTDQETLLLLEAMEIYSDNWNEIAEHVGTKSKAQCILHFVSLPMDDGLLEKIEVPGLSRSSRQDCDRSHINTNGDSGGSCLQDPDSDSRLPFANSGNPVMSMVAFLASAVGPRVAAACAHASLAALSEDDPLSAGSKMQMEGSGLNTRVDLESTCSKEGATHGDITNSMKQNAAGSWDQNDGNVSSLSAEKVKIAAKAGLSASAMKAKLFADHEEREIQRLSANIINHQLKRLELKLKQFAEVESLLMKECDQVERARQRFATERTRVISSRFAPSSASLNLPSVGPSGAGNTTANNRQEVMSASTSQPTISSFGNNQPIHPHMPYMPRQPMFGLGPRLPLTSINTFSSAQSNAMFNSQGSTQSTALSHPMLRPVTGTSSGLS